MHNMREEAPEVQQSGGGKQAAAEQSGGGRWWQQRWMPIGGEPCGAATTHFTTVACDRGHCEQHELLHNGWQHAKVSRQLQQHPSLREFMHDIWRLAWAGTSAAPSSLARLGAMLQACRQSAIHQIATRRLRAMGYAGEPQTGSPAPFGARKPQAYVALVNCLAPPLAPCRAHSVGGCTRN